MMPWFKVDDKLHDHPKARRARARAMGVWVMSGSWCADHLTDGFVPLTVLSRWGTAKDATTLVSVGLWHPDQQDGEDGFRFHDWPTFQPTRASKQAERDSKAEAGRKGGILSGRSRREANAKQSASGLLEAQTNPRPGPVPVPSRSGTGSESVTAVSAIPNDGLTRIQQLTNGDEKHARKCAAFVLAKTNGEIRDPVAYVLAAIRDDPDAYRYRRGNPKREQECPTHAGQWADACAGCAADRKASA